MFRKTRDEFVVGFLLFVVLVFGPMIKLDTDYIFAQTGGVKGLLDALDQHCPGHGVPYATAQMWKARRSIPSAWTGAVLYVMSQKRCSLIDLLVDDDELCAS